MRLIVKFNLVFIGVFLLGLVVAGRISYTLLQKNAQDEILQNARIMMQSALAMRNYTSSQIKPLLETQMKYSFLPQTVPAYAATESCNDLRSKYPEYGYKEATLNPTNPRDRTNDWEADIVNQFRQSTEMSELIGERDTPIGRSLYLARPIQIKNGACLECHSTVEVAPKTMIEKYGPANGFGWKLNETVGAQIVSVPTEVPLQRAEKTFKVFMLSLTGVFAFIFIVLNLMLFFIVIRPVTRLSKLADEVSLGNMEAAEFNVGGKDEIGALAGSFDRMRKSLVKAFTMLEEQ
jgi:HAMP domain-containing protein